MVVSHADLRGVILAASAPQFWVAVSIVACGTLVSAYYTYRNFVRKRLIENTATSKIRSATQGYVELQGYAKLIDGEPILADLSRMACVWYRYTVERKERTTNARGQTETRWRTLEQGRSDALFYVEDETGRCVIDPDGATVTPSIKHQWYGMTMTPPRIKDPASCSVVERLAAFGCEYRYLEERIDIGAPLCALGLFRTHGGAAPTADATRATADLLREWKADRSNLLKRYDTNRDGDIDPQEWEQARRDAVDEVARRHLARPMAPAVDVLGATTQDDQPFVIAALRENDLVAHYARRVAALGLLTSTGAMTLGWALLQRIYS
ncbi:MAG: hypothetical protein HYX63_23005 [Gammaproteobacteria bacterium]|nr:hypothetical protein [Gammaproteobacteria bacterium]